MSWQSLTPFRADPKFTVDKPKYYGSPSFSEGEAMITILFSETISNGKTSSTRHVARTVRKKDEPVTQTYVSPGSITAHNDLLSGGRVEEAMDKDGNWRSPQAVDAREDAKFWAEYDEAVFELQMQSLEEQCEKQKE